MPNGGETTHTQNAFGQNSLKHNSLLQRRCYMYDYGHACQATGAEVVIILFIHVARCLLLHTLLHVCYDECNHLHPHCYNLAYGLVDSCLFDLRPHTPFFIVGAEIPLFIL
jgi:hypothetical protein